MKILNLYAGIGGNRKLWGDGHEITAVELDPNIATIYKDFYPNDEVIVTDAHQYLLEHYKEFDFIWTSPPCQSHSKARFARHNTTKDIYADMTLYEEIIFLKHYFKGNWLVENVNPYYEPLIEPSKKLQRHLFWCNFEITDKDFETEKIGTTQDKQRLAEIYNIDIDNYKGIDKRQVLRNCVLPELGLHILESIKNESNNI